MNDKKQVATKEKGNALATAESFEMLGSAGFDEVTTDDIAIPFLRILADGSPQVKKRDGAYVEGAEPGMIYNTVLSEVYDGEQGIKVIPCHYNRRFVEWIPSETKGGGYVQSFDPSDPIVNTTTRDDQGRDVLENGNYLANTAQFFVLFMHKELGVQRALIAMTSTQLKKSRKWLAQAQSITAKGKNGVYTLPLMSQVYTLSTMPESNDKGSWYGWDITRDKQLDLSNEDEASIFDTAVGFGNSVKQGEVQVKSENADETWEGGSDNTANDKNDGVM